MNVEAKEVNTKIYQYKDSFGRVVYESLLSPDEIQECKVEYRELMACAARSEANLFKNHLHKAEPYYRTQVTNELSKTINKMLKYYIEDAFNETLNGFYSEDIEVEEYIGTDGDFKDVIVEEFFEEVFERAVKNLQSGLSRNGAHKYNFSKKISDKFMKDILSTS